MCLLSRDRIYLLHGMLNIIIMISQLLFLLLRLIL